VVVVAILYGATVMFHSLTHQSTDDAFIDVHVVSIASKIAGRVTIVHLFKKVRGAKSELSAH
jgi:multidrug resistance efflux pump